MKKIRLFVSLILLSLMFSAAIPLAFGQNSLSGDSRELKPRETLERSMTGAETHRYKFALRAGEFFQVRVEQKGVDVALKLTDTNGNELATMDSPNGKDGFEMLSFVAKDADVFLLNVVNLDAKVEKARYVIKRESSRMADEKDKRRAEAERNYSEAMKLFNENPRKSLETFRNVLKVWQEIGDTEMEKVTAFYVDFQTMNVTSIDGIELLQKAQKLGLEGSEKASVEILNNAKKTVLEAEIKFHEYGELGRNLLQNHFEFAKKIPSLKVHTYLAKQNLVTVATFLSTFYQFLLEPKEQIKYAVIALEIAKEATEIDLSGTDIKEDHKLLNEIIVLQHLASAMKENKNSEAISYYEQTLSKYREIKKINSPTYRKDQEAAFLQTLAFTYSELCKGDADYCNQKTIENYNEAIKIYDELKDYKTVATLTYFISGNYLDTGEVFKSFESLDKSISLAKALDDKWLLSNILFAKASLYFRLGDEKKSKEILKQGLDYALSIPRFTKDIESLSIPAFQKRTRLNQEYTRLSTIAGFYGGLNENAKAVDFYKQGLLITQKHNDKLSEADSLKNIGSIYQSEKDWQNAIDYYQQSNRIAREIGYKQREAFNLRDIGFTQLELYKPDDALKSLTEAQVILSSLDIDDEGVANGLAKAWNNLGNRQLAIFYGKKLVNWIQNERVNLSGFDRETQQTFVNSFEKPIRRLAEWLIEEGRFAQAEQVLRMLKEEEFSGFVRRDSDEIKTLNQRVELNKIEREILEKYNLLAERVSEVGRKFYELDEKKRQLSRKNLELSESEQKQYADLEQELKTANDAFRLFLDKELVKEIGEAKKTEIGDQFSKQGDLQKLGDGAVTLYTVVGENRYRVILTTPKVQVDGKYEIKAKELNKKVYAFRAALQNPAIDPRPLGKELYDILIKPIEKNLRQAGAKTLIWSLDGTLRYVPLAALSPDGVKYLVEDYQSVVITSKTNNLDIPKSNPKWQALGVGVSSDWIVDDPVDKKSKIPFDALPGAKTELMSIVKDEESKIEKGVLPGKRFMDTAFTVEVFKESLKKENENGDRRFNVVHIASHFRLGGNNYNSFLLLGGGRILTLHDISGSEIKFSGVDLITLSACNTAFADANNGVEVDSLAEVIQHQGGKSVLATLWAVADESTQLLMSEFYRLKKENPGMSKADALRAAQIAMIKGELKSANSKDKKIIENSGKKRSDILDDAIPFAFDANKPYSHPYFWSPFVLIGNWR